MLVINCLSHSQSAQGKPVVVGGSLVVELIVVGGANFVVGITGTENHNLFIVHLSIQNMVTWSTVCDARRVSIVSVLVRISVKVL